MMHTCRSEENLKNSSPSITWVLGKKPRLPGLDATALAHWPISQVPALISRPGYIICIVPSFFLQASVSHYKLRLSKHMLPSNTGTVCTEELQLVKSLLSFSLHSLLIYVTLLSEIKEKTPLTYSNSHQLIISVKKNKTTFLCATESPATT